MQSYPSHRIPPERLQLRPRRSRALRPSGEKKRVFGVGRPFLWANSYTNRWFLLAGDDSSFFATVVLPKTCRFQGFPEVFLERRMPGKNGEGTPAMLKKMSIHFGEVPVIGSPWTVYLRESRKTWAWGLRLKICNTRPN